MKPLRVFVLLCVMPLVSCVSRPATLAFAPTSFPGSFAAATPATAIEARCATTDVVKSETSPASSVSVTVNSTGECPLTVKLMNAAVEVGSVTAQAGKSASISTSGVTKVTITCGGTATEANDCRFTYSISWK